MPSAFPFVPLKLKDRSKQRFRSNSMALWNSHASKALQHKTNRKHTERLPPHRSTVVQNVNELTKWYRLGCGTAAHRVRSAVRANILSGIFAGKSSCKKPLWAVFAAGCPVKSPPQAANRFSSFEVSKKRACRKASPAFAHVLLKSRKFNPPPALGKNTAQIIEKAYADSFFLPLLRLRASTLRPLAVLMRLRKPWTFFLCLTLGWKVIFIVYSTSFLLIYKGISQSVRPMLKGAFSAKKISARQISEENPIVSQLVIIAAMPPFCQARIRTSEPVFILFLQYIIIFLFASSCSIPQPVPFGRVCFPPCLNSRFCSAQPHCVRFNTHRRLHFVLII